MTQLQGLYVHGSFLIATALFIVGLRQMGRVRTARDGARLAAMGMLIATVAGVVAMTDIGWPLIGAGLALGTALGVWMASTVKMTGMPELVALFNGLGGAASALVAAAFVAKLPLVAPAARLGDLLSWHVSLVVFLSVAVGSVTLTGSLVAWGKLAGRLPGRPVLLPGRHAINLLLGALAAGCALYATSFAPTPVAALWAFGTVAILTAILGVLLVVPIGGADMPVVISLLNSYSGVAASMAGFVLLVDKEPSALVLIIAGALVGASGLILTQVMCKAMNRSLLNVLVGGFGEPASGADAGDQTYGTVRSGSPEEVAMLLDGAERVIMIPGYGLAVAQAQHALAELDALLTARGAQVQYGIHPVAGRMPGHMNVLLSEANVPYEKLFDLEINSEMKHADVAIVVGANDVANPDAIDRKQSPIYGMPILLAHEARSVVVIKRSLSPGYAGIKNPLFENERTLMCFLDAKQALVEITRELKDL